MAVKVDLEHVRIFTHLVMCAFWRLDHDEHGADLPKSGWCRLLCAVGGTGRLPCPARDARGRLLDQAPNDCPLRTGPVTFEGVGVTAAASA